MVVPFAKVIKEKVDRIPVIVVNSLEPDTAEQALEENCADIIALGRPLIADPYLPRKLAEGRREDVLSAVRSIQPAAGKKNMPSRRQRRRNML